MAYATCGFLASVEVLFVAQLIFEFAVLVNDASGSHVVGFTTLPVSIRGRVAVVPFSC